MTKLIVNNQYIEICEMPEENLAGRVKIKMSALEIVSDNSLYNSNGISWLERYILANLDSAIGMPYVVSWFDEENQIPSDHGKMEYDDDGNLIFEGVSVGSVLDAYIEDVEIDGETKKLLMTEGFLYSQRYNLFIKWIKEEIKNGRVYGSIEINGKGKSKVIEYLDGATNEDGTAKNGRVPIIFDFTGLAILYLTEPSDKSSIVFEVNSKQEDLDINKETNKGGKESMTIEELNAKIAELNAQLTELNTQTTELNSANVEKDAKITELTETLVDVNKSLEEVNTKCSTLEVECNGYKEEKVQAEVEKKEVEINTYFETEIPKNNFEEAEVNSLKEYVEKCDLEGLKNAEANLIVKKFKEGKLTVETNSKKEEENNIFFHTKEEKIDDIEAGKSLFS